MLAEAQGLRGLIEEARTARVPGELNEAAEVVESVSRLVAKAVHEKTHKVTPINFAHRPDLAQHWEAVREELETTARDAGQHRQAAAS